jgi:hypothetical protein
MAASPHGLFPEGHQPRANPTPALWFLDDEHILEDNRILAELDACHGVAKGESK